MKQDTDYYRLASGFYQSKDLPENYLDLDVEEFEKLLEDNAWQPFEDYLGSDIAEQIEGLAFTFEQVARDTRKKVLDEVRERLNIK